MKVSASRTIGISQNHGKRNSSGDVAELSVAHGTVIQVRLQKFLGFFFGGGGVGGGEGGFHERCAVVHGGPEACPTLQAHEQQ